MLWEPLPSVTWRLGDLATWRFVFLGRLVQWRLPIEFKLLMTLRQRFDPTARATYGAWAMSYLCAFDVRLIAGQGSTNNLGRVAVLKNPI